MIRSVSEASLVSSNVEHSTTSRAASAPRDVIDRVAALPAYDKINFSARAGLSITPPPPDNKSRQLTFNIGDSLYGSIPSKWLEREPNSRLAQILRRDEACPTDTSGRPYLEDIQLEDWPAIRMWLSSRILPLQPTPSLRTAALLYGLTHLSDACRALSHASSTHVGDTTTVVYSLHNAAARLLSGNLTESHWIRVRSGGYLKLMQLTIASNGRTSFCIRRSGDGLARGKRLNVSIAFGSLPATPLCGTHSNRSYDFVSAAPDHRLLNPFSDVYLTDATLPVTVTIVRRK